MAVEINAGEWLGISIDRLIRLGNNEIPVSAVISIFGSKSSDYYKKAIQDADDLEHNVGCYADCMTMCIEIWWSGMIMPEDAINKFKNEIRELGFEITNPISSNGRICLNAHDPSRPLFNNNSIKATYRITIELINAIEFALIFI